MLGTHPGNAVSLDSLRDRLGEHVNACGEPGWDTSRRAWNLITDQRPELVVLPGGPDDVAAALEYARSVGLKVAVQSTGHGAGEALGNLEGQMLPGIATTPRACSCPTGRCRSMMSGFGTKEFSPPIFGGFGK